MQIIMKKIISLSILLSIISCVGFEKKMYDNDLTFINSKNYEIINGNYENYPYQRLCCRDFKEDLNNQNACLKDYLVSETDKYFPNCSKENSPQIRIIKEDKKYFLVLTYIDYENKKQEFKIEGKFSNGFFKLNNYSFKANGIPYIFGGAKITQSRVGLDSNKNLIIQKFTDNEGALFLIFWAGHAGDYALKFRRK